MLTVWMHKWYLQPLCGYSSFSALPYHYEYPRVVKLAQTPNQFSSDADSDYVFFRRIRNGWSLMESLDSRERKASRDHMPQLLCLAERKHKMICCAAWNTSHSLWIIRGNIHLHYLDHCSLQQSKLISCSPLLKCFLTRAGQVQVFPGHVALCRPLGYQKHFLRFLLTLGIMHTSSCHPVL